jgi:hypothetical protein
LARQLTLVCTPAGFGKTTLLMPPRSRPRPSITAGCAARERAATQAAALLRPVRPVTVVAVQRKRRARQLLADVRLDRQVKTASQTIRTAVGEHGTTLTEVFGVGAVLAAKLLGHAATSPGSLTATTSPATAAPLRSRPPAAMFAAIG